MRCCTSVFPTYTAAPSVAAVEVGHRGKPLAAAMAAVDAAYRRKKIFEVDALTIEEWAKRVSSPAAFR